MEGLLLPALVLLPSPEVAAGLFVPLSTLLTTLLVELFGGVLDAEVLDILELTDDALERVELMACLIRL